MIKDSKRDNEMKQHGDEEWDEEMKGVQNVSSQICREPSLVGGGQNTKVAQNVLKHILVLKFWKSDEILKIEKLL